MRRTTIAVIVAVLLLGAACTSSDDEVTTTPDSTTSAAPSTSSPDGGATASSSTTAAPLTASFRGVTADTIEVGVAFVDFQELVDLGVFANTHGDEEAIWEALLADLNGRGGINGRVVEAIYDTYLPIGPVPAEEMCLGFTEDAQVFAVLGLWVGETVLCITDTNDTIYVGQMPSQELMDRSQAVLASPSINPERQTAALLSVLLQTGRLDGAKVGIFGDPGSEGEVQDVIIPFFEANDIEMGSLAILTDTGGDLVAGRAEVDVFIERWRPEDLTMLFYVGNNTQNWAPVIFDGLGPLDTVTNRPEIARPLVVSTGRPDAYAGMLTANGLNSTSREQYDEPLLQECMALVVAAVPGLDEVTPPSKLGDEIVDWYTGIRDACETLTVFEAAAVAAGPELTNDSFRAGLESLGSLAIPGKVLASFGPGKWDGEDGFRLYEFDADEGEDGAFVPLTDIVDVTEG